MVDVRWEWDTLRCCPEGSSGYFRGDRNGQVCVEQQKEIGMAKYFKKDERVDQMFCLVFADNMLSVAFVN